MVEDNEELTEEPRRHPGRPHFARQARPFPWKTSSPGFGLNTAGHALSNFLDSNLFGSRYAGLVRLPRDAQIQSAGVEDNFGFLALGRLLMLIFDMSAKKSAPLPGPTS